MKDQKKKRNKIEKIEPRLFVIFRTLRFCSKEQESLIMRFQIYYTHGRCARDILEKRKRTFLFSSHLVNIGS